MLSVPQYIVDANIQDNNPRYCWDEWNEEQGEANIDQELVSRLGALSQRAILAFMCGSAEWIVHRFGSLCIDTAPQDFIEAAWAKTIHTRYSGYGSTDWQMYTGEDWRDSIKGPLRRALERLEIAMQQMAWQYESPISRAGVLEALVSYVLPDSKPYKDWCQQFLTRMESLYALDLDDVIGDVVPRESVDPGYHFEVKETESLCNHFLSSLDYRTNQFLSPPEAILEPPDDDDEDDSFTGTPYVFTIEADRQVRNS